MRPRPPSPSRSSKPSLLVENSESVHDAVLTSSTGRESTTRKNEEGSEVEKEQIPIIVSNQSLEEDEEQSSVIINNNTDDDENDETEEEEKPFLNQQTARQRNQLSVPTSEFSVNNNNSTTDQNRSVNNSSNPPTHQISLTATAYPQGSKRRLLHRRVLSGNHQMNSALRSQAPIAQVGFKGKEKFIGSANDSSILSTNSSMTSSQNLLTTFQVQYLQQKNAIRRWQCSFVISLIFGILIASLISALCVIFYVFRMPYVYIDQISITKIPQNPVIGFYLTINSFNINLQTVYLTAINIDKICVKDISAQTSYDILSHPMLWDLESNGTIVAVEQLIDTSYYLSFNLNLTKQGLSQYVINKVTDLVAESVYSTSYVEWSFKGRATVKIGNVLYKSIGMEKTQQYFVSQS
nr:unnamed protein product [Naegleria fowleri]